MFVNEALRDFVGSVIVGDLFSDDEDVGVMSELLIEGFVECLSNCDFLGKVSGQLSGEIG